MGTSNLANMRKIGSMGKPSQHPDSTLYTRVRLVDDGERDVPVGQVGEVLLQSPALMVGYYRDPERTADAMRGGWFHTGDDARQDEDGFFFFVDRKKDIIRRRGENIASVEIERVLNDHPAVAESAVIPVPSALSEDDIHAYVVLKPGAQTTAEELQAWCEARLARFKMPQSVRFVTHFPRPRHSGWKNTSCARNTPVACRADTIPDGVSLAHAARESLARVKTHHTHYSLSWCLCFVFVKERVGEGSTMTHENISLFDAIHSQRAVRHFSAQPVSDEMVETILHAAICAPNGETGS
jgi:acyl-CoA synthetase (AMP-forming)/AMP-acid ligase II